MNRKTMEITRFLTIAFILVLFAGIATASFGGGSGTSDDPYQIETLEQLQSINVDLSAHYELIDDIDASDTETWNQLNDRGSWSSQTTYNENDYIEHDGTNYYMLQDEYTSGDTFDESEWIETDNLEAGDYLGFRPLGGDFLARFSGSFDGQGHVISDLYINRGDEDSEDFSGIGMFGRTSDSIIENIGLEDVDVDGECRAGGLVGYSCDSAVSNSYATGTVNGGDYNTGGLVGYNRDSAVSNSYATGTVSGESRVGGLVGRVYNTEGDTDEILYSYANSDINPDLDLIGSTSIGGTLDTTGSSLKTTSEMTEPLDEGEMWLGFDGWEKDYIGVEDSYNEIGDEYTFSTWLYFKEGIRYGNETGNWAGIYSGLNGERDTRLYMQDTGSLIDLTIGDSTTRFQPDHSSIQDRWAHIVVKYDGSEVKLYIDGEEEFSDSISGDLDSGDDELHFGVHNTYWLDGSLDDVRIYNRSLSEDEIQTLNETRYTDEVTDGLVGWWPMNESESNTTHDYSGNENHGSIEGAEWAKYHQSYFGWDFEETWEPVREQDRDATEDNYPVLRSLDRDKQIKAHGGHTQITQTHTDWQQNTKQSENTQIQNGKLKPGEHALEFDGVDEQSVEASSRASNMFPGKTTINMWVEFDSDYTSRNCILYTRGDSEVPRTGVGSDSSGSADNVNIQLRETDSLRVFLPEGGDGTSLYATATIPIDEPVMVTITWDEDSQENRIYLDGELEAEDTSGGFDFSEFEESDNAPLIIGNNGGDQPHKGIIDDARIYDRALNELEVEELYEGEHISDGLVGHWPMQQGENNTAYDQSPNNNHGDIIGANWTQKEEESHGTWTSTPQNHGYDTKTQFTELETTQGQPNQAMEFDGTDDYVTVPDDPSLDVSTGTMTVSMWVNTNTITDNANFILERRDADNNGFVMYLNDGRPTWWLNGKLARDNNYVLDVGEWYHLVGVYDGSDKLKLYINGSLIKTNADVSPEGSISADTLIGIRGDLSSYPFNGLIDDVRIYDRALSEGEIQKLYSNRYQELGDEVAWYPMQKLEQEHVEDWSTDDNHGEIHGATWTTQEQEQDTDAEVRIGADKHDDGEVDEWSQWKTIREGTDTFTHEDFDLPDAYNYFVEYNISEGHINEFSLEAIETPEAQTKPVDVDEDDTATLNGTITNLNSMEKADIYFRYREDYGSWNKVLVEENVSRDDLPLEVNYTLNVSPSTGYDYQMYTENREEPGIAGKSDTKSFANTETEPGTLSVQHQETWHQNTKQTQNTQLKNRNMQIKDQALEFEETDEYADLGNVKDWDETISSTWSIWLYVPDIEFEYTDTKRGIFSVENSYSGSFGLYWDSDEHIAFSDRALSGGGGYGAYQPNLGEWVQVTGVRDVDNDIKKLYINGEEVYDAGIGDDGESTDPIVLRANEVAGGGSDSRDVPMKLDDARLYDRALSSDEVEDLYKGYNVRDGLVGHWPMDRGKGNLAQDKSGNDNHGEIIGAEWTQPEEATWTSEIWDDGHEEKSRITRCRQNCLTINTEIDEDASAHVKVGVDNNTNTNINEWSEWIELDNGTNQVSRDKLDLPNAYQYQLQFNLTRGSTAQINGFTLETEEMQTVVEETAAPGLDVIHVFMVFIGAIAIALYLLRSNQLKDHDNRRQKI